jgi:hypothetical protein
MKSLFLVKRLFLIVSIALLSFTSFSQDVGIEDENPMGVTRAYKAKISSTGTTTVKTISINYGEAGVLMVFAAAADGSGNGVTGAKLVRYRKSSTGILTLGTVQNVLAVQTDTGMTGAGFGIAANNNDIIITVTGPNSLKEVAWRVTINPGVAISLPELP